MNYRSVVVFGAPREVTDRDEMHVAQRALTEHVVPRPHAPTPDHRTTWSTRRRRSSRCALDEASAKVRTGPPLDPDEDLALDVWAGVIPARRSSPANPTPAPDLKPGVDVPGVRHRLPPPGTLSVDRDGFASMMAALADAWNAGDSRTALALFADDAHYVEPPDEQRYEGHEQLFEFFGRTIRRRCRSSGITSCSTRSSRSAPPSTRTAARRTYHGDHARPSRRTT